jgi:hypothetical protein
MFSGNMETIFFRAGRRRFVMPIILVVVIRSIIAFFVLVSCAFVRQAAAYPAYFF